MRRFARIAGLVAALAVVGTAGIALAGPSGSRTTKSVSATFTATTVKHSKTTTCTGSDGTYAVTHATYTGSSTSSDPRLNGTLVVDVESVLNTSSNLGTLKGHFHIRNSSSGTADGSLTGVLSGGTLQGLATGHVHGPRPSKGSPPSPPMLPGALLGNVTASFSAAGGFTSGSLGSGSGTDTATVMSGSCPRTPKPPASHPAPPAHPSHPATHKPKRH